MWKRITGYEALYEVSETGEVRSVGGQRRGHKASYTVGPRLLKPQVVGGYLMVRLYRQHGKGVEWEAKTVHRLVAQAFIENPLGLPVVNHKDGNKQNCHADNLEWMTQAQNMQHAFDTGLKAPACGSDHGMVKLTESQVREIRVRLAAGESQRLIAIDFNVSRGAVRDIKTGKSWRHLP
jgi:hypothetical protein